MVKKFLSFCLIFSQIALAGYLTYDDTGRFYLTLSADERYIYLWQLNGQLASAKFPYALPDDARLLVEPYFEDIDGDGSLEIAAVYQDKNGKYYKLALRQNGEIFDERNWPRQIDNPGQPPVIVPIEDENLLTLDGRDIYNQKYNYYQGLFRHVLYEENGPAPQNLAEIYSRQPTHDLVLSNTDTDFERYLLLVRRDAREKYNFFAELASPNTEITLSLNYGEGIYPWTLLTYDWLNNYTAQEILYYYDHTPPDYAEPAADRQIYFSPNDDGRQDTLEIETTPSDNLYYTQTVLLDIFDGPTYIATLKRAALTFAKITLSWNGRAADGQLCADKTYQGIFTIADGCGNVSRATTLNIVLDTQEPQIWTHNSSGAYFTPNGDNDLDALIVTLELSEQARAVLNIYNAYDRRIKTLQAAEYQTNFEFSWDGLDNDGIIENGNYGYEIILTDRAGNVLVSERYPVFLDYKSPLLLKVGPEQAAYNFNQESVTFNFEALETLQTALYIINASGEIIATVNPGLTVANGSHSFSWDGRLNDAIIPDGVYNYRLVARNAYGNANAVSGVFYADSSLPPAANSLVTVNVYVKTANQPEPRYISANAEVKYAVNAGEYALKPESGMSIMTVKDIGYITSRILAEDGAEIATLAQNELTPAGSREYRYRPAGGPSGKYYFLTEIKDLQNKPAAMFSREEFILDTAPPVITGLRVLNTREENYLTTRSIDLEVRATDNLLPVTEITFSPDGQNWDTPNAYAELRAGYARAAADGAQTVYARVKDAAGNWSEPVSVSIIVDTTPPRHLGLLVNGWPGGAVGTVNVSVNFLAEDAQAVKTVKVSYNDAYSWVEYPYGADINFQLDPAAGAKDFYLKYTDALGNESGIYRDTVFLDRAPPQNLRAQRLSPYYTNTRNVVLRLAVEDNDPIGAETIGLRNEDTQTETILPYTPSENYVWPLSAGDGEKSLTLVAYDHAGNRGNSLTLNYVYDTVPPEIVSSTVVVEPVYLPTLREPLRVSVTANEPVQVLLSVRRDGELVYQTAPAEVTANEQAAYAEYKPELSFGWAGQNNSRHYLRGGATYNIEYQIVDRVGNPGAGGSEEIYLGTSYELVSANYDLTLPAIQA
ncbi:MAG: hypothetical protein LBD62_01975, partial [Candidatus Margulisbacteria bacterium]|nr:hypothetical protein [Candidatus Margulisiibacteriota bacterium]